MDDCRKKTGRIKATMIIILVFTLFVAAEGYCLETYFDGCSLRLNHQDTQELIKILDSAKGGGLLKNMMKRFPRAGYVLGIISASAFVYKKWISYADEGNGVIIFHKKCGPWWMNLLSSVTQEVASTSISDCVLFVRTRNE